MAASVEALAPELPPEAVKHLETEIADIADFKKHQAQVKAELESLKKDIGCLWPVLRLLALTLTLIVAGALLSLLCVIISLLLCVLSVIFVLVAAMALLLAAGCLLAALAGLIIAPPVLIVSTATLSKLRRAISGARKQIQADAAQAAKLVEWLEANQDAILARIVSLAHAATPAVKAKLQGFAGVGKSAVEPAHTISA